MMSRQRLQGARELVNWLGLAVPDQSLPDTARIRASGSCFRIAQEHHHAIVLLMHYSIYASCFALLRVEFESYLRGLWLALCADDSTVAAFLSEDIKRKEIKIPGYKRLIKEIEDTPGFNEKVLSGIVNEHGWKILCAYTHTGGLHVQRWNISDAIEPNYKPEEVEQVLCFAELIAAMSVIGMAQLACNDELAMKVLDKMRGEWHLGRNMPCG
jgi:hypothetical protein